MKVKRHPMVYCCLALASLAVASLGLSVAAAGPVVPIDLSVKVQYRALVDGSIYGHSGKPASTLLDALPELAATQSRTEFARQEVVRELTARAEALEASLGDEPPKDAEAVKKQQTELTELKGLLGNDAVLNNRAAAYADANAKEIEASLKARRADVERMIVDVEPVCEPAAAVLNDALAQKVPATLNPNLVELASFYPGGTAEPVWADLVRSRRIVVYTDGDAYCRLFLPGRNASSAWEGSYGVVRHILRSLLKPDRPDAALTVDVYAYENDIASTTFRLHLGKLSKRVTANDLGTPQGLRPINLDRLSTFFEQGLTLEGCGVNAAGDLVLIGRQTGDRPTLDGHPIELSDLAAAYRAAAYAGHGESYMSLDPAEDESRVNVNFGGRLQDTRLGWVAYRCDLRFKTLGDDLDAVTYDDLRERIRKQVPDFESQQFRQYADLVGRDVEESTRFWFYPDDFKVEASLDGKSCLVTRPRFTAAAERQQARGAEGVVLDNQTPQWTSKTLAHFNANYDKFARLFPEVRELDDGARLLAVGEWLHQARQSGRSELDVDALLAVELPPAPTPRSRDQLRIQYAEREGGAPGDYKAYCLSTVAGRDAFARDSKTIYEKAPGKWKFPVVTAGGLDYSARKAVAKAATAEGAEAGVLNKVMKDEAVFDAGNGRKYQGVAAGGEGGGGGGGGPPRTPPGNAVTAAADGEFPPVKPGALDVSTRRYDMLGGGHIESLSVADGEGRRYQKSDADAFDKDGALHATSVDANGRPERFSVRTSEGLVTLGLKGDGNLLEVVRLPGGRQPNEDELRLLAATLIRKGVASTEVWNKVPADAAVHALDVAPTGESLVLFTGEDDALVLRVTKKDGTSQLLRGDDAIHRMHEVSAAKVRAFSVPGKVELMHVRVEGEQVTLAVGKREPTVLDAKAWGRWLAAEGDAAPPEPVAKLFAELAAADEGKGAELVVMRDALQGAPQRLRADADLTADAAVSEKLLSELQVIGLTDEELVERSAKLLAERPVSVEDAIETGRALKAITDARSMTAAQRAERAARLNDEINWVEVSSETAGDVVGLAAKLKSKLPRLRVSLDDPSPSVAPRVLSEGRVSRPADVGLAIPPAAARVDDKGMLFAIREAFVASNMKVIKTPADLADVGNVIVIAAHNDKALWRYVRSLGEFKVNGKSALDGKFIMLETCFESGNPDLVSEMLRRYNCTGVHVQSDPVAADAVKRVLIDMAAELKTLDGTQPPRRLREIYESTVRKALQSESPELKPLRGEFQKLLNATVQWCGLGDDATRPGSSTVG